MSLSKTDFIQYLNCPKSVWLLQNKPAKYPVREFSEYAKKLVNEGYLFEDYVRGYRQLDGQFVGSYETA